MMNQIMKIERNCIQTIHKT